MSEDLTPEEVMVATWVINVLCGEGISSVEKDGKWVCTPLPAKVIQEERQPVIDMVLDTIEKLRSKPSSEG